MQVDPTVLHKLLERSDEQLWQTIVKIGAQSGIAINQTPPPKEEMERLRTILSGAGSADYAQALALVEKYRNKR